MNSNLAYPSRWQSIVGFKVLEGEIPRRAQSAATFRLIIASVSTITSCKLFADVHAGEIIIFKSGVRHPNINHVLYSLLYSSHHERFKGETTYKPVSSWPPPLPIPPSRGLVLPIAPTRPPEMRLGRSASHSAPPFTSYHPPPLPSPHLILSLLVWCFPAFLVRLSLTSRVMVLPSGRWRRAIPDKRGAQGL